MSIHDRDYQYVLDHVFAIGTIPDGFFGDRATVKASLIDNEIIYIARTGYIATALENVSSVREAIWLLKHHPSTYNFKLTKIIGEGEEK